MFLESPEESVYVFLLSSIFLSFTEDISMVVHTLAAHKSLSSMLTSSNPGFTYFFFFHITKIFKFSFS